jgi:hypothetical protein
METEFGKIQENAVIKLITYLLMHSPMKSIYSVHLSRFLESGSDLIYSMNSAISASKKAFLPL